MLVEEEPVTIREKVLKNDSLNQGIVSLTASESIKYTHIPNKYRAYIRIISYG